jgi:uncharacterized integral membrane protein (TIGR00698 family)
MSTKWALFRSLCQQKRFAMNRLARRLRAAHLLFPGLALTLAITAGAIALEGLEIGVFGRAWLESLVLAILLGTTVRSLWHPSAVWTSGIDFSAKTLLEIAVMLLGASISTQKLLRIGPALACGIALVVVGALVCGYLIGRLFGLSKHVALLVACGNSICGNSAIAAVAPVIDADPADIATSIAFTAVLGVAVVIALPLLIPVLKLSAPQYGVLAGLTVYAVPQVLAATIPVSQTALQIGTIVKLVRVLMLGPVLVLISVAKAKLQTPGQQPHAAEATTTAMKWTRLVPWFIVGFIALTLARSAGIIPQPLLRPIEYAATSLTIVSMAALGLGVDVRTVTRAGAPVIATATVSLLLIGAMAILITHIFGI